MKTTTSNTAAEASGIVARSTDLSLASATAYAETAADQYGLPQTVYRNETSGGWWHTNALANLLRTAQLHVTVLPERYFL